MPSIKNIFIIFLPISFVSIVIFYVIVLSDLHTGSELMKISLNDVSVISGFFGVLIAAIGVFIADRSFRGQKKQAKRDKCLSIIWNAMSELRKNRTKYSNLEAKWLHAIANKNVEELVEIAKEFSSLDDDMQSTLSSFYEIDSIVLQKSTYRWEYNLEAIGMYYLELASYIMKCVNNQDEIIFNKDTIPVISSFIYNSFKRIESNLSELESKLS